MNLIGTVLALALLAGAGWLVFKVWSRAVREYKAVKELRELYVRDLFRRLVAGHSFRSAGLTHTYFARDREGVPERVSETPQVVRTARTIYGLRWTLRVPEGMSPDTIVRAAREGRLTRAVGGSGCRGVSGRVLGQSVELDIHFRDAMPQPFRLEEMPPGTRSPAVLTVGRRDDGSAFEVGLAHFLCIGATGSGKGSALWSIVFALDGLRDAGLVVFYGVDPKRSELHGVEDGFIKVAYDLGAIADLLDEVVQLMDARKVLGSRTFVPTQSRPFVVLILDELNGVLLDPDAARRKRLVELLNTILSQGRSLGVYVVAAAQQAVKEVLGQLRGHFGIRFALRVESPLDAELVLGVGAVEAGARPHEIEPATESNGYATAGVAYARSDGEPEPVRFRFPYISDDDIARWISRAESQRGIDNE